jgi:hypothetical protein
VPNTRTANRDQDSNQFRWQQKHSSKWNPVNKHDRLFLGQRVPRSQWLAHLLPVPAAPGSNHGFGNFFGGKIFSDVAVLIDRKDSASKSLIVDRTHPGLVRVVLQKKEYRYQRLLSEVTIVVDLRSYFIIQHQQKSIALKSSRGLIK